MNVDASKLNTHKEWEVLSGNCVRFLFFRMTVGPLCTLGIKLFLLLILLKRHCICLIILFPVLCSLSIINTSLFLKHNQTMHLFRGDFLNNIILYLQHIVNHPAKMEAHAWPEISAPVHMVLWDQDVIQVSKKSIKEEYRTFLPFFRSKKANYGLSF